MSKVMDTTGLGELLARIAGEWKAKGAIYDIPEKAYLGAFELESASPGFVMMGRRVSLPVGPAAGPNSQIAPNLVAAYLSGSRVFELKTVQEKDRLEIDKPCIDVLDEGYNTEWSTELSLDEAREEYLRGWIAIKLLASVFSPRPEDFVFNMSVGYTLAGIKGARMDAFIEGLRSPAGTPFWKGAMRDLAAFVEGPSFAALAEERAGVPGGALGRARALVAAFPSSPVHSVTISTMHGCPPAEIEAIAAYLIEEKGFDTFVKLNPTLLGFDEARRILDATGWKDIEIHRDNFEHDLQFADAMALVASLHARARKAGRRFGIKLSNTLANANTGSYLPGAERYMSGRALFPLTVALAAKLAAAMEESLPDWDSRFSYCGGVWAANAGELIAAGMGPLTVATDILKPGGYLRLIPAARAAVAALSSAPTKPDPAALAGLAELALGLPEYRAHWKSGDAYIDRALPLYDCFAAPCTEACPVKQKVPEYIRLQAQGASTEAIACILEDNPLPFITGTICDHVCQDACCRNDYEGSVEIRSVKLSCARAASIPPKASRNASFKGKTAVIGAGPAGLACAHYLALSGAAVSVFDSDSEPGGVPVNVIPGFRIPRADLAADIDRIRALGVEYRTGSRIGSLEGLRAEGYDSFFVSTGAPLPKDLAIEGDAVPVVDALEFLKAASRLLAGDEAHWPYGRPARILVAGGGNTAMDAARISLRLPGVEEVRISYRRAREDMPCDIEELDLALDEGTKLLDFSLPESSHMGPDGSRVTLRVMRRGEIDASGRAAAVPSDKTESLQCELLVAAIGENPDRALLESLGLAMGPKGLPLFDPETQESSTKGVYVGGDAARGPKSIISAEADGWRAACAILRAGGIEPPSSAYVPSEPDYDKLAKRGELFWSLPPSSPTFVQMEADRCLRCDSSCLRCVEVCPNRSNFALPVDRASMERGGMTQPIQILHVDALCNECGNCGRFCPFQGEPYRGKPTLFRSEASMDQSRNAGFAFAPGKRPELVLREAMAGAKSRLAWADWSADKSQGSPMAELARRVFFDHAYLLGGEK